MGDTLELGAAWPDYIENFYNVDAATS